MGKPASMTSTRIRSSALAILTFSSLVMEAPGLCSPSRRVVSKIIKRLLLMSGSCPRHRNDARHYRQNAERVVRRMRFTPPGFLVFAPQGRRKDRDSPRADAPETENKQTTKRREVFITSADLKP
ncbi:hypothetical protein CCP4SC76_7200008 [Gammaproteobacteria bacterium]